MVLCVSIIFLCPLARLIDGYFFDRFWGDIRTDVFTRMDALMFGVGCAGLKLYWPMAYSYLQKRRKALAIVAIFGFGCAVATFTGEVNGRGNMAARSIMFSYVSVCSALLVVALDTDALLKHIPTFRRAIEHISIISYSVYLVHNEIFPITARLYGAGLLSAIMALLATWAIAYAVYATVERYFLQMRNRPPLSSAAVSHIP